MHMKFASTLTLADILVFGVIVFFAFRGFMKGVLRELFSFLRVYLSFIIAALFYRMAQRLLQNTFDMPSWIAQMISFITIFIIFLVTLWLVGAVVGKRVSKPETTSALSRIGGTVLGLAEGALIVSAIIMVVNFHSISHEVRSPLEDAISYKIVEPIAPSIRDLAAKPFPFLENTPKKSESD